jgi:hypothetical protein
VKTEQWDTSEIELTAAQTYGNPFTDVALHATFRHQDGTELTVEGFHDGGDTWRIRFMPTRTGAWTYSTASNDRGLGGQTGTLECVPATKSYLHGPLRTEGYHFRHADGIRRFLTGTRLSNHFAEPESWTPIVDFLAEHRINRVFFMMVGIAGTSKHLFGDGPDFTRYSVQRFQAIDRFVDTLRRADILASPYLYYFNDGLLKRMSIEEDRAYISYSYARFGAYSNILPCLSNEVEQKYTGREDKQYNPKVYEWAAEMGALMKEKSVFGQAVTVHNPMENFHAHSPGFYSILLDWQFPWADYMMRQMQVGALGLTKELRDDVPEQTVIRGVPYGNGSRCFPGLFNPRSFARNNQLLIELRRHGIPVINEEPGYEMQGLNWDGAHPAVGSWNSQTSESLLSTFWTATTAGAYTIWGNPETYELEDPFPGMSNSVVPGYVKVLHDFMTRLPYYEMEPANELVSPCEMTLEGVRYRTNFCLAKRGEVYLVYAIYGRTGTIQLQKGPTYTITRLSPRTGVETRLGTTGGGSVDYRLPLGEWVLLYRAS